MLRQRVAVALVLCAALWLSALIGEAQGNELGPFGAIPAYSSLTSDGDSDESVSPVFVESEEATSVAGFGDFLKKAAAKVKNFFKKVGSKISGAFKNLANHFKRKPSRSGSKSSSSSSGGMKMKLGAALGKADAGIKFAPKKASPPPPPPPKFGKMPEPEHSPAPLKYPPPPSTNDPFTERLSSRGSSEFDATANVERQMKKLQQDAMKTAFKRMAAVISVNQDPQDYRMLTEKGEVSGLTRQVLGPHPAQEIEEERQAELKRKNPQNKPKIHVIHSPEVHSDKKPKKVLTLRKGRVLREAKDKAERKKMEKTLHEAEELEQDPGVGEDDPIPGFHEPPGTVPRNDWDDKINRWRHRRRAMREREQ